MTRVRIAVVGGVTLIALAIAGWLAWPSAPPPMPPSKEATAARMKLEPEKVPPRPKLAKVAPSKMGPAVPARAAPVVPAKAAPLKLTPAKVAPAKLAPAKAASVKLAQLKVAPPAKAPARPRVKNWATELPPPRAKGPALLARAVKLPRSRQIDAVIHTLLRYEAERAEPAPALLEELAMEVRIAEADAKSPR